MPVDIDPFPSDERLPSRADVVVVGGGIVGVSTALCLAERGVKVVLCEKGVIAGEQSSRNWGWCRTMGRDPREVPLMQESLRLWRSMNERVGAETGFRQIGTLYICPDEKAFAKREAWLPFAREHGVDSRLLRGAEVNHLLEGSADSWVGALYTPGDGVAEPSMAVPAMALAARRLGATIMTHCAVRGLDLKAGRIAGVVTEKGRIDCDRVVLAGGVWSSLFCRSSGLRLPQLKVLASVLRTAPIANGPSTAAWGPGLSLRKRLDGGYTVSHGSVVAEVVPDSFRYFKEFLPVLRMEWSGISLKIGKPFFDEWQLTKAWSLDETSPFETLRTLDPSPVQEDLRKARANLERAFPAFKGVATAGSWGGMIDATPDLVPVISAVESLAGLVISTGFSGHGFGIGPGAGRLTADIAMGSAPVVDPTPFRFSRFTDGTDITPKAGL
ncbi:glycine/D-amino acid oxidase-like deaminating enzyme [Rhodoligotrophos appendicifer]|uniref:NAD(P)/FAD-dependent oxidoreductase n=1 Tax=Rhodoligotrophos appendicifer TaxID=987056 RepID=UPI001186B357|nr:FAD-binding oxidoreductase [Rhodoligotrophos appendicifer]